MSLCVDAIRDALEGAIPAVIATAASDGTPNVSYLSEVHYVDERHVALSFQFFNKTRQNVLVNPRATVQVIDPFTAARYVLSLQYLRTESSGPLFESMKAKLAGIASHVGMDGVFALRGADVYRVLDVEAVPAATRAGRAQRPSLTRALRQSCARIAACADLSALLDEALAAIHDLLGIEHSMVLVADAQGARLYTVASRGYARSGIGSEIPYGHGVIGVAARERTPIRIQHLTHDRAYALAARGNESAPVDTEIPFPGLAAPHSQLAVPIAAAGRLAGVLFVESEHDHRFRYDDEEALGVIAAQLGVAMHHMQSVEPDEAVGAATSAAPVTGAVVPIRRYAENDSVFVGDDYLIKGVAGAIVWKLLRDHVRDRRTEFSNRELRLDPSIRLPDLADNLEARLTLLQRRLAERAPWLVLERTGRGRFRFCAQRPVELREIAGPVAR